jgi:hypothetical protein
MKTSTVLRNRWTFRSRPAERAALNPHSVHDHGQFARYRNGGFFHSASLGET